MDLIKFLPELLENVNVIIESNEENKPKQYFIEGVYIQADTPNRNGRLYPLGIVLNEVNRFRENLINTNRALGELGHPESGQINLERVSHLITDLKQVGNDFTGRAKLLDTPMGKIAKNFVDEGVKLGVSTRGFGSLTKKDGLDVVGKDFHLSTIDIVADPSGPNCFINGVMENKDFYVSDNGQLMEATQDIINELVRKKQLNEEMMIKVFEDFLKGLK